MSVKDIANKLKVSRGSVSVWCRDVILTEPQRKVLYEKQVAAGNEGRQRGVEVNKQRKQRNVTEAFSLARMKIGRIDQRDLLMLGIGLYWGEGVKSESGMTSLVNSDPALIKMGMYWMTRCLGVKKEEFRPYVYINASHEHRVDKILTFWQQQLGIAKKQFHKPIIVRHKNKKFYSEESSYNGVLALRVVKSTNLKYQIQGMIKACQID